MGCPEPQSGNKRWSPRFSFLIHKSERRRHGWGIGVQMKIYYLLFLLLSLISNAQVQKKFYGVPFGVSTEQTKLLLSNQGIHFQENDSEIQILSVKIGNYPVDKALMRFKKDRFYMIEFCKEFKYPYLNSGEKLFNKLYRDLNVKYSILEEDEMDDGLTPIKYIVYRSKSNGKVFVTLTFMRIPALKTGDIKLRYYENKQDISKPLGFGGYNNEL